MVPNHTPGGPSLEFTCRPLVTGAHLVSCLVTEKQAVTEVVRGRREIGRDGTGECVTLLVLFQCDYGDSFQGVLGRGLSDSLG